MKHAVIIGIAGPSGSGKSLFASTIVSELGSAEVAVLSEDAYYKDLKHLPFEERAVKNFDHPDSFDHRLLIEHLKSLVRGEVVETPVYDHSQHIRTNKIKKVGPHALVVVEGILLFTDPELREQMDIMIYIDTPLDICLIRRLQRDVTERARSVESVIQQYENTVRPMYLKFIEPSRRSADIIVPRGGKNRIAIDMIKAKMNALLGDLTQT